MKVRGKSDQNTSSKKRPVFDASRSGANMKHESTWLFLWIFLFFYTLEEILNFFFHVKYLVRQTKNSEDVDVK